MVKLSAIELAAGITADYGEEIEELESLMKGGTENADKIKLQYNHISSALTGVSYTIEYIEDEEAKTELKQVVDNLALRVRANRIECLEIYYSAKLGKRVTISQYMPGKWCIEIREDEGQLIKLQRIEGVKEVDIKKTLDELLKNA